MTGVQTCALPIFEKTLLEKVPGVTGVRDATDHATGSAPYLPHGRT